MFRLCIFLNSVVRYIFFLNDFVILYVITLSDLFITDFHILLFIFPGGLCDSDQIMVLAEVSCVWNMTE